MSVDFQLQLIDQITGPARKAEEALKRIQAVAEGAGKALDFKADTGRALEELSRLKLDPKGFQTMLKAQKAVRLEQEKLTKALEPKNTFLGMGAGMVGGIAAIGAVLTGALVGAAFKFGEVIKDTFVKAIDAGSKYENLKLGFKLSLGEKGGAASRKDIERFADSTGFDDDEVAGVMLPMLRAGMDQKASRTAFSAAQDIAAGEGKGGDLGRIQGLTDAFTHIKLKGGVQERLLPNMGVDVKSFYKDLAKELHTTVDDAKKRAEEGKVDPQLLLNKIYGQIERRQGGAIGTGGDAYGKTFAAYKHRLEQLPENYLKKMQESPAWDGLSKKAEEILTQLSPDSPNGQKIMAALFDAFDTIVKLVKETFTPENIKAFTEGLVSAVNLAKEFAKTLKPLFDLAARFLGANATQEDIVKLGGGDANKGATKYLEQHQVDQPGIKNMDQVWDKVRDAEGIGFFQNLNMDQGDRVDQVNKALGEGKITPYEAQTFSGQAKAAGKTINVTNNTTVNVDGGKDPHETGKVVGAAVTDANSSWAERTKQEAGL